MISRPNQTHMKQSDLGKSLDPIPHQNVLTISASDLKRRVLDYACLNWRSLVKQKDWKHALQVRAILLFMLLRPASVSSPRTKGGGVHSYTLAGRQGGLGAIFWKKLAIGLASYSIISLRIDRSFAGGVERRLIRSVLIIWRLGNLFSFLLKDLHHKISKKPFYSA
jgi:hypothetical protein